MPDFCERCFWIHRRLKNIPFQIPMPGIFSSIDSYVKNVMRQVYLALRRRQNLYVMAVSRFKQALNERVG